MTRRIFALIGGASLLAAAIASIATPNKLPASESQGGVAAKNREAAKPNAAVAPDRDWDAAFTHTSGWIGGDVAGSLQLPDGRTLWMFGDSWIGEVKEGHRVGGAKMVNNSIAITPTLVDSAKPPSAEAVKFYWNTTNKTPTAWAAPKEITNATDGTTSNNKGKREDAPWYWTTGGAVVAHDPANNTNRVAVFLFELGRKQAGGDGVWNFENRGGAVAVIDNPSDAPGEWRVTTHALPYWLDTNATREDKPPKRRAAISWGMAAFTEQPSSQATDATIYIYGLRERSEKNGMVIARVPSSKLTQTNAWEYFVGNRNEQPTWTANASEAEVIAKNMTSEFSVEPIEVAGNRKYVLIQSEPMLGKRIYARWSDSPTGPWSDTKPFFVVPDIERHKSYFTYAAKGHVALSRPGELLVTYLVNSHDFGVGFRDAEIYRPRFLRVPLHTIEPAN